MSGQVDEAAETLGFHLRAGLEDLAAVFFIELLHIVSRKPVRKG